MNKKETDVLLQKEKLLIYRTVIRRYGRDTEHGGALKQQTTLFYRRQIQKPVNDSDFHLQKRGEYHEKNEED